MNTDPALDEHRYTILVVDDDPQSVAILTEILAEIYRVRVVTTGDDALAVVRSGSPPDLITLDLVMPGIDGLETCRRIKAHPQGAVIPILFLTASTSLRDEFAGFECGAVDYIQKPVSPALVQARVAVHLELSRARIELEERNQLLLERARLEAEVGRLTRHDLNNGLAVVVGVPEALLMRDNGLTPAHKKSLHLIVKAGKKMAQILNRTEDFLKLESGQFRLRPNEVHLQPLFEEVIASQRAASDAKALSWSDLDSLDPTLTVVGDELLLYSLLANLTKNAIEASPPKHTLHLRMVRRSRDVEIILRNHGAIPRPIRGRFFEKYSTYGKLNGTGLGNYTAALITHAHGGTIEAKVIEERDTEIHLTLPLEKKKRVS